jgi:hypothetical protein
MLVGYRQRVDASRPLEENSVLAPASFPNGDGSFCPRRKGIGKLAGRKLIFRARG